MKPRVVHIVPAFDPTGAAEQAVWLQQALADSIDTHIVVWGQQRAEAPLPVMPSETVVLPRRAGCDLFAAGQLRTYLRTLDAPLLHSWLSINDVWGQASLAWIAPRKRIISYRDSLPRPAWWSRRALMSAARVIAPTAQLATQAIETCAERAMVSTIPDAVTVSPATDKPARSATVKTIVACGRFGYADHWQDAIWAADILRVVHPGQYHLRLLTSGEQTDALRRFIRQIEIEDAVQIHPQSEWPERLAEADVFWSLNTTAEAPRALLTAIAERVPVVACQSPTHAAWIEHDRTGRVIQGGDRADLARQTLWLFEHPQQTEQLTLAAQRIIYEQHAPEQMARRYEPLYGELTRQR